MDIVLMILYATIVLGILVFIHEGGHYLASRAFGVRVTEFMLGLPGPSIGFTKGGTKFGVTPFLLGGYAKVCGMEPGEMSPHLEAALASLYRRGTANMEDIARDCGISDDDAYEALEELVEWGSAVGPTKKDQFNTYRAPEVKPGKKALAAGAVAYSLGEARPVDNPHELFESEYRQQYRSLPFWKRSVILVAGVVVNLVFAVLLFVILFSVLGLDMTNPETGAVQHVVLNPLQAIQFGFMYIGTVVQFVIGLFNPATAADTVSNSSSIIGIAAMSKTYFDMGAAYAIFFTAMISVSLGIMNLLPIPPLDGGRLVIEIFQKVSRKVVSMRALNYMSLAGMALFLCFFLFVANQDIQRFVFGNW
ncbi:MULTISPECIES: site-2 protease family protein [Gordonibacter]|uniref:Site-2 protease family protein n=1 Tax=Gordonibacter faecis TaxID=3047475 RepID=A0ABT7DJX6_9ACTN|nr:MULTISPECIES: site-2 protease family protein [unclassified Gordonibacter]MDJ1649702.1 site-2 protease family protein [Gordonibacter sp. KGMB12511]HIW76505.1 site-2 protease family protein [Candidatus Gordonibacter avicola]